jgi:hypothetical protein
LRRSSPPPTNHLNLTQPDTQQGERTLAALIDELLPLTSRQQTPQGQAFRVTEVILVNDGAIDDSTSVMKAIASQHPFVTPLWLS